MTILILTMTLREVKIVVFIVEIFFWACRCHLPKMKIGRKCLRTTMFREGDNVEGERHVDRVGGL